MTCCIHLPIRYSVSYATLFLIIGMLVFNQSAYAHDTAIGVRLRLSVRVDIVNNGTTYIGPFQLKLTDLDTGLMDVKQHNPNDITSGTTFHMSLPDVEIGDKLVACVQRYDTGANLCQFYTVADQDFDTPPVVNIGLNWHDPCGICTSVTEANNAE